MFDLAIWVGSYVGVGFIRKAIHIVRIEKDLILSDCSYNKKIIQILSASKIFGLLLFLGSVSYFIIIQSLFMGDHGEVEQLATVSDPDVICRFSLSFDIESSLTKITANLL